MVTQISLGDSNDGHPQHVAHNQQHESKFDMTRIEMPMQLKSIPRFETENNLSVSIYRE